MKKQLIFLFTSLLLTSVAFAQSPTIVEKHKLYDPSEDATVEIATAVKKAANEGKHVLLQFGGNWCKWCIALDSKIQSSDTLRTAIEKNYVVYHVNYSKENMNEAALSAYGYPHRFGFPVLVVLDGKGNRLHTQNSAYLEEGNGHSTKKVMEFLQQWSPTALDPKQYKSK